MRRRDFIAATAGAAAGWPLAVSAQAPAKKPQIAVLMLVAENDRDSQARITALRDGLAALGWIDGTTATIEYRWASADNAQVERYATELLALRPQVIVANGTPVVTALKNLTQTVPIVAALVQDPVGLGLVQSLARPGGNITGFTFFDPDLLGKWRELLAQAVPSVRRSALLFNPTINPAYYSFLRAATRTPQASGEIFAAPVESLEELRSAVAAEARAAGGSLIIGPDAFVVVHMHEVASLALEYRLPGISIYRKFVEEGGLMSYGPDVPDVFRHAAGYVDRILKGAHPAELPVQQPTKFEFAVNLKTAKALGVAFPPTLLATADEVIE